MYVTVILAPFRGPSDERFKSHYYLINFNQNTIMFRVKLLWEYIIHCLQKAALYRDVFFLSSTSYRSMSNTSGDIDFQSVVTIIECYGVTVLRCYGVTALQCYVVTVLQCYVVTVLRCYSVTVLQCYNVTVL